MEENQTSLSNLKSSKIQMHKMSENCNTGNENDDDPSNKKINKKLNAKYNELNISKSIPSYVKTLECDDNHELTYMKINKNDNDTCFQVLNGLELDYDSNNKKIICLKNTINNDKYFKMLHGYSDKDCYVIIPVIEDDDGFDEESDDDSSGKDVNGGELKTMSGVGDYKLCYVPWFIATISIVQIFLFVHHILVVESQFSHKEILKYLFLWQPALTLCVWRFAVYSLYHIGWIHLCFNIAVQLSVGVPLEMIHGAARVSIIYFCGVILGSLSTMLVDNDVVLVGSSGGVYALLAAHLADIVLNYPQMELGILKLLAVIIIACFDITLAWLEHTSSFVTADKNITLGYNNTDAYVVSYIAHLTGAITGFLVGLATLKTFSTTTNITPTTQMLQKVCRMLILIAFLFGAIIAYTDFSSIVKLGQ